MIAKLLYSLRWKLIALFIFSIVLSVLSLVGVFFVLLALRELGINLPTRVAQGLADMFTIPVLLVVAGSFFFTVYIFVLTRRRILYMVRITEAVQRIANGRFDERIPVRYNDEMGELAANLNKMSEQLKTSIEEERRAERTKTELITNVSHDLRTPLTSITGYLGLIEQDRYRDEVELRHYVHIAFEKSKRLHVLIDDLFEYTRLSGGGLSLRKTRLDLVEMIGQLAAQFQYEMGRAGMEIRLHFPDRNVMIEADGDKLARVFDNLLANAVHYGKDGVYVDVHVRSAGGEAVAEIVNYGEPIPPQDLPYIFDRFYRVEKSRSNDTGGSGLGLAIAKQIVELHGGTIGVASDRSRTVFEVRLPASPASVRRAPGATEVS
ncbi:sensor histidine kinase [Paenibacillus flagellatus]|uniref:histidine kinase n=1 Tax=Paenibacillus flagellatus TaxID=2211139 RepID=A0A2V5KBZ1_9BACL|nr:HAMP domain-containing sensor histidine kinase [Paenibacillus flagellatus]PYI57095.1 two-component sensor histidine kinase [Paenibacillus flagellatus]